MSKCPRKTTKRNETEAQTVLAFILSADKSKSVSDLCKNVGVARETFYDYSKKYDIIGQIKENYKAGVNAIILRAEDVIKANSKKKPLPTVKALKERYFKCLEAQGKTSKEAIDPQLTVIALRWIDVCRFRQPIESSNYTPIIEEFSREGSVRFRVNPSEGLYDNALTKFQDALQAGAMNYNSKAFEMAIADDDDENYENYNPEG